MNTVTIEVHRNTVVLERYENTVSIELIRIHTDSFYYSSHQVIPQHKEVGT